MAVSAAAKISNRPRSLAHSAAITPCAAARAGAAVTAGRRMILIAESTAAGGSGVYLFTSDGDADVEAAELIQVGFVPNIFEFTAGDFLFVP